MSFITWDLASDCQLDKDVPVDEEDQEGFEETEEKPVEDPEDEVVAPIYYSIVGEYALEGQEDNLETQVSVTFTDAASAAAGRAVMVTRAGKECLLIKRPDDPQ